MNKPKIVAYLKPTCGWSQGVRAIMRKYDLPFEDRDIINDPVQRQEMIEKSGQMLSPCVEVNGHMLPDISGEEVEAYLLENKLVGANDRPPTRPPTSPAPMKCRRPRRSNSAVNPAIDSMFKRTRRSPGLRVLICVSDATPLIAFCHAHRFIPSRHATPRPQMAARRMR